MNVQEFLFLMVCDGMKIVENRVHSKICIFTGFHNIIWKKGRKTHFEQDAGRFEVIFLSV